MQPPLRMTRQTFVALLSLLIGTVALDAQVRPSPAGELPVRIVGNAISAAGVGNPTGTARVEIVISRISPEAERARLLGTLKEDGEDDLLEALRTSPSVGTIQFNTELAWDLRYAQRVAGPDGGVRFYLATDRPMSVREVWTLPLYTQYPFTVIDLHLGADGRGSGTMMLAASVTADGNGRFVHVENYASHPIQLNDLEVQVGE